MQIENGRMKLDERGCNVSTVDGACVCVRIFMGGGGGRGYLGKGMTLQSETSTIGQPITYNGAITG